MWVLNMLDNCTIPVRTPSAGPHTRRKTRYRTYDAASYYTHVYVIQANDKLLCKNGELIIFHKAILSGHPIPLEVILQ